MGILRNFAIGFCVSALVLALHGSAHADVRYTTQMIVEAGGAQMPQTSMTTEIKGMWKRDDMNTQMGPYSMHRTTLTLCDKHEHVEIDRGAQVYTVGPIDPMKGMGPMSVMPHHTHAPGTTGTGHVILTYGVQDNGVEQIGKFNAHHYMITMRVQSSGCAGNNDSTNVQEIWVAPGNVTFFCPEMARPTLEVNNDGCKITYEMKGDATLFANLQRELVVQRKMVQAGGRTTMTMRITDYSTANLPDSDFEVPAGFAKVSQAEFDQAAMRQFMPNMQRGK